MTMDEKKQPDASTYADIARAARIAQAEGEIRATEGIGARVMKKRYHRTLVNDRGDGQPPPQGKER